MAMHHEAGAPALELIGIEKRFGPAVALRGAHFTLRQGTVHALLGENGAGKTTLLRIAYGLLRPDVGELRIGGRAVRLRTAADAIALGIGMVHQHFTNVPAMTVAENVALGGHGRFDRADAKRRVQRLGAETGLVLDPAARAGDLRVGAQQRLEIVKALARDARVLVLDEPTAVLAPAEAEELLRQLRAFASGGRSVVLITHKLREAMAIANDVTVLRRGRTVLAASASAVSSESLATAMIGEAPVPERVPRPAEAGAVVVRLDGVMLHDEHGSVAIADATMELRGGEILGIAGVEGSGHYELLRAIAGRLRAQSGKLECQEAVAFVPEDRQRDGLVMGFSLVENVALKGAGARRGRIRWSQWRRVTEAIVADYDVRPDAVDLPVRSLSGGNQQKLVLGRELSDRPAIIVAENPTRGLDIRAAAAVHARLREASADGMAVVVYSSDLDEILALATRVIAVHAGRLTAVSNDRDDVGRAMLGVS